MTIYSRIKPYIQPYAGIIIVSGILLGGQSLVTLSVPKVSGYLIDSGALQQPTTSVGWILFGLGLAFVTRSACMVGAIYLLGSAAALFVRQVRAKVHERLMHAPLAFHISRSIGEHTSRLVNDVAVLHGIVSNHLPQMVTASFLFCGGTALLLWTDWRLTIWFLVVIPPVALLIRVGGRQLRLAVRNVQKSIGEMSALASENLHAIHTIKAFGYEDECHNAVCDRLDKILNAALRRVHLQMIFRPTMGLFSFGVFSVLAWTGTWALDVGRLSPGVLVSFLMYVGAVGAAATKLAGLYGNLQEALGAADRVFTLLDTPIENDGPHPASLPNEFRGDIELRNVNFSYVNDVSVLQGISFRVPAGRTVALVGSSGCGKSTILNLILKFYEPTKGSILIDGIDLRTLDRRALRQRIGYVPQDTLLFRGTIRSNLLFGVGEASQEAIHQAAQAAFIHDFIRQLPQGYDTPVGEGGMTLSAGQRQRIALARMLLKDPPLMLLDEPTSALDKESEQLIREILRTRFADRTVLLVTHEPRMIQLADRVVTLSGNRIDLQDTPQAFLSVPEEQPGPFSYESSIHV